MRIFISGAHRTGKTTLAKAYSERYGIPYLDANIKGYWASIGTDARTNLNGSLLENQAGLSNYLYDKFFYGNDNYITDRSLLDVLVYSELMRKNMKSAQALALWRCLLKHHMDTCSYIAKMNDVVTVVVKPSPHIQYVDDPLSGSKQSQHAFVCISNSYEKGYGCHIIDGDMHDLEERIQFLNKCVINKHMELENGAKNQSARSRSP